MANPFARFALKRSRSPSQDEAEQADVKLVVNGDDGAATSEAVTHVKVEASALNQEQESTEEPEDNRLWLLKQLIQARREGPPSAIDLYGTQACVASTAVDDKVKRFHILVAALLSSQTQDPITHAAMQRLHTELSSAANPQGVTVATMRETTTDRLEELLKPVGFYRRKAEHLKRVVETLHTRYNDDIPRQLSQLIELPGIGPKIARVILLLAWDQVDGIIVDTHVHRLSQRLGWTAHRGQPVKTPEDTREALEDWIPRAYWGDLSRDVVGFGQTVCVAVHPHCINCPLAPRCPSAFKCEPPTKKRKKTTMTVST
ncbi:hypothetical protein Poli38472_002598 [Pythium oligandrum]|uniref:Endonuclease III homolog n=1 Tax=Pythium oligandrum TaxID=41045 RepID=A0A8K1CK14_PYTOL|nr:hypothetical protein Poli38472_002598 [Pythium oligandrum]|eukprot:TMW63657.1 hypothetical protein Poli38472_002598 [Pythium oligandrum]